MTAFKNLHNSCHTHCAKAVARHGQHTITPAPGGLRDPAGDRQGLIHRTTRGELVRSKSEVIIANLLHALGTTYAYEQPLTGKDGSIRYPDFTIEDAETGRRVFLEHLGP